MSGRWRTLMLLLSSICAAPFAGMARPAQSPHDFSDYPATVFSGPFVSPAFKGSQRPYAAFRTRLREAVKNGVGFGGHYAVAVIGCGAGCRSGYIIDLKTGLVSDLPYGGEEYYRILYRVRPNSRLLETQWEPYTKSNQPDGCRLEDFVWTGRAFKSLGQRKADECPEWNDYAG